MAGVHGRGGHLALCLVVLEHRRVPASVSDLLLEELLVWVTLPRNGTVIPMRVQVSYYLIVIDGIHSS